MKTNLILLLITLSGLSPLLSQRDVYLLHFDSTFAIDQISVLAEADPWRWKWDTLWTTGDTEEINIEQKQRENPYIIIGWNSVNFLYDKGMLTGSGFDEQSNMRIAPKFQGEFKQAHEISLWFRDQRKGKQGKRKVKVTWEILDMSNAKIYENLFPNHSAPVDVPPNLDRWMWRYKMNMYLIILFQIDVDKSPDFLGHFHKYEQGDDDYWYPCHAMGTMVFASYMELNGNPAEMLKSIETHEQNIRTNPGKMFYVYKYASLLHELKKKYAMPIGVTGEEKIHFINSDTSLIYYPGNIELDYIRKFIRQTTQSIDIQQRVFISEVEKRSLEEMIHNDIIVIDFWGTWCKPCVENMPKLNHEASLHPDVQFISLASDKMKSWTRYVRKHDFENLDFVLIDGDTRAIYSPGVNVFPTYMIIDSTGEILHGPVHTVEEVKQGLSKQ